MDGSSSAGHVALAHASIAAADNPAECAELFRSVLRPYKIDTFSCGEVDLADRERSVFFVIDWPERWRKFYFTSGLIDRDPVVGALARRREPFTWSELRADRTLPQVGREALDLVAAHGWTEGLVVPIPRGGMRVGLVSLVGERHPLSPDEKSLLALLSVCFHERVRAMAPRFGFPVPPAGLSDREVQCLALIARGRSDREIGVELGISSSTAHEYAENAKRKLKVCSRPEAVAMAVSLGIIAP